MVSLHVNAPIVVAEVFDTEVVVIHLERGTYYSLTGAARQVWTLLGCGLDAAGIIARLTAQGGGWSGSGGLLEQFLRELEVESLIRSDEGPEAPTPALSAVDYQAPRMEKFTDMEELIALDPVHDVSNTEGWPLRTPIGPETH